MSETKTEQWAVVDLFGHQRIAGKISEHAIGGCSFVRVDVPEVQTNGIAPIPAHTRLFGSGAIYGIAFVSEATARLTAEAIKARPLDQYEVESALRAVGEQALKRFGLARLPAPATGEQDDIPI